MACTGTAPIPAIGTRLIIASTLLSRASPLQGLIGIPDPRGLSTCIVFHISDRVKTSCRGLVAFSIVCSWLRSRSTAPRVTLRNPHISGIICWGPQPYFPMISSSAPVATSIARGVKTTGAPERRGIPYSVKERRGSTVNLVVFRGGINCNTVAGFVKKKSTGTLQ